MTANLTELASLLPPDDLDEWADWYASGRLVLADWLEERSDDRADAVRSLAVYDETAFTEFDPVRDWPLDSIRIIGTRLLAPLSWRSRSQGVEVCVLSLKIPTDPLILWHERVGVGDDMYVNLDHVRGQKPPLVLRVASPQKETWAMHVVFRWAHNPGAWSRDWHPRAATLREHTRRRVLSLFLEVQR